MGCPLDLDFLLDGLRSGFDINVSSKQDLSRPVVNNLPMDRTQELAVTNWIIEKREKAAIWGPWHSLNDLPPVLGNLRVSPLGAVQKGEHFDKEWFEKDWRVIHHLSHPKTGTSVNSEIGDEFKEVSYIQFKEVVALVHFLGPGAYLWTIDAKDAYLRVPIKEHCFKFMGFRWMKMYFVFTCLSFGLASACRIYTLFADWVRWIIMNANPTDWWFGNRT